MPFNFFKDLSNKPYEVRRRIFWFAIAAAAIILFGIWVWLIKNYKPQENSMLSGFKIPSVNEIMPPKVMNKFNEMKDIDLKDLAPLEPNTDVNGANMYVN